MTLTAGHIPRPSAPARLRRAIEAQVPQKVLRDLTNRLRFGPGAPLSDERLYAVPRAIRFQYAPDRAAGAPGFRRRDSGRVIGGDWDLSRIPVEENEKLQSCRMHFEDGLPWDATPQIRRMRQEIAAGSVADKCKVEAYIRWRYSHLDELYAASRQSGRLKTRRELPEYYRREHGGILVHVARDGSLLRAGGGNHRFALAWILRLPEIPVQLGVIHAEAFRSGVLDTLRLPLSERDGAG